jgi:hypothetical protein
MALTKDQILKANDLQTKEVKVKEWGGSVRLKEMDGLERDAFESRFSSLSEEGKNMEAITFMLSLVMVDENGRKLFETPEEMKALTKKNPNVLVRLFDEASKLNALAEDAEESKKN